MAYTLYITRPPHFASRTRRPISAAAWTSLIARDDTLRPLPPLPSTEPPAGPSVEFIPDMGLPAQLHFAEGNICCMNPDEPTVDKMVQIAEALDAVVQGEDGEFYTGGAEPPYLIQFSLLEPVSQRLRVRFPTIRPPLLALGGGSSDEDAATFLAPEPPAAEIPTPETIVVQGVKTDAPSPTAPRRPAITVFKRLGPMSIGFPTSPRKPSPALAALLTPLRPVEPPPPAEETTASV